MTQKTIYILNGHPGETSLSRSFAETYAEAARAVGHDVRVTHLHELEFDPDFGSGNYSNHKPLEPQLEEVLRNIEWSQHMVLTTPMWWGGLPAKLKGLIDRILLPGRAFDTRNTNWAGMPSGMLTGRTARVFLTSDTPGWFLRLMYRNAILWQLRGQVFKFVGFRKPRITHFTGASEPGEGVVERWLGKVRRIGAAAA